MKSPPIKLVTSRHELIWDTSHHVLLFNLEFFWIVMILAPILQLFYPALIVLSLTNIAYKFMGFQWEKTPVAITLILTIMHYFWA